MVVPKYKQYNIGNTTILPIFKMYSQFITKEVSMSKSSLSRQNEIYQSILSKGRIYVSELSESFRVSTETIRKDLDILEQQGLILKKHGYAEIMNDYFQLPLNVKITEHALAKQAIAKRALEYIKDNSMIFLDPGSTTLALAKYLPLKKGLTIITNSLAIAQLVSDMKHDLIFTGGKLQKKGKAFVGAFTANNIDAIQIDTAFMGCDGFLNTDGPTTFSFEEVLIKQHVIKKASQKILLCDASKFKKTGTYTFASFKDYDIIITNPVSNKEKELIKDAKDVIYIQAE